jgi:transposase InsO family protein
MYDKSIVAHSISPFIDLKLVTETVEQALVKVPYKQRQNLILHSDQGWHFTNWQYRKLLVDNNIIQSISARGSSVDNVPIESFFSILKSECIYLIDNLYKKDIETVVNNFINYYNNERLQEKIKELTPIKFRELTLSASF